MRSQLRQSGRRLTICHRLRLLLLAAVVAAESADWKGSRDVPSTGSRSREEWNTTPKNNWWQYKCPRDDCEEFFQSRDMLTYKKLCRNRRHKARVHMQLVHRPGGG